VATKIQLRRDTAANWTADNPILAQGEQGHETDTNRRKIGDGVTAWNALPYIFEAAPVVLPIPYEAFQTGTTNLNATPQIIPLNTQVDAVTGFTQSGSGIQVSDAGPYSYSYVIEGDSTDNDRAGLRGSLFVNGVEVVRTRKSGYCRNVAVGEGGPSRSGKLILAAGDIVTLRGSIFGDNVVTIDQLSSLMLEKKG